MRGDCLTQSPASDIPPNPQAYLLPEAVPMAFR